MLTFRPQVLARPKSSQPGDNNSHCFSHSDSTANPESAGEAAEVGEQRGSLPRQVLHYIEQQVSVVSQLEKLRIGVSALGGCIQECLGVLKAWSAKDIANDTEEVNEGDLDLSLAMSTQPHASAPHTKSAREHDCTAPSSSAGTTASVAAARSMPTTAGRCSNLGSEGATQG